MKDCLKDAHSPCEVIHTGKTADGGVDLMMILDNDESYLVQVKRRTNLSSKEGVKVVRELNGVLFREGKAKGMIITTASGYTKPAVEETKIKTCLSESYNLGFGPVERYSRPQKT
jgi:HJR/Mrr/RecB family endonuclease